MALAFDGEKKEMQSVETGIPQGSPISPILFLIYIRPLFDRLKSKFPVLGTPSYIDDVGLVYTGRTIKINVRTLQEAAREIFKWAEENAVTFNDSKSELIHFTAQHHEPKQIIVLPNGIKVYLFKVIRWLRVWFECKLLFHTHILKKSTAEKHALEAL